MSVAEGGAVERMVPTWADRNQCGKALPVRPILRHWPQQGPETSVRPMCVRPEVKHKVSRQPKCEEAHWLIPNRIALFA